VVGVEQPHNLAHDLGPAVLGDVFVRLVHQAVRPQDLVGLPVAVGVEVVQGEERGGVEAVGVVLLWMGQRTY
jgi:hypothetical protein